MVTEMDKIMVLEGISKEFRADLGILRDEYVEVRASNMTPYLGSTDSIAKEERLFEEIYELQLKVNKLELEVDDRLSRIDTE